MDWQASPSGTAIAIDFGMLIQSAAVFKAKVLSLKSLTGLLPGRYALGRACVAQVRLRVVERTFGRTSLENPSPFFVLPKSISANHRKAKLFHA
ncbi:hypothetical protein NKH19_23935 [Mesorhizobium sp. M1338]|uniref:hypothetical protein n=1 Tax=unclassified Mesorhizobium TaxID=325217 RepID=UPI003339F200